MPTPLNTAERNTLSLLLRSLSGDAAAIDTLFGVTGDGSGIMNTAERTAQQNLLKALAGHQTGIDALFSLTSDGSGYLNTAERSNMDNLLRAVSGDPAALDVLTFGGSIPPPSAPLTGSLQPTVNGWFWDTQRFTAGGSAPNAWVRHDAFAKIKLLASGTLTVEAVATNITTRNTVDIAVDGVYSATLTFTALNTKQTQTFSIPSGTHTVEVIEGQSDTTAVTSVQGTGFILLPVAVKRRMTVIGASGSGGFNCQPASASWYGRLRAAGRFDGGYNLWQTGFGLTNWGVVDSPSATAFVTNTIAPHMDATVQNYVYVETDAGEFEDNFSNSVNPTTYATNLGFLFDAIHSAFPSAIIINQSAIIINGGPPTESTTNPLGFLLSAYRTASAGVCAARTSFVRRIDGIGTMGTVISDLQSDGLHEIPGVDTPLPGTGHAKAFRAVRQVFGQLEPNTSTNTTSATCTLRNSAANFKTTVNATSAVTKAWWRSDAGITIGTTPLASGTSPPAVTWAGTLLRQDVLQIQIDGAGTGPAATFKISQDGGNTFVLTGQSCAATVTLFAATTSPVVVTFPNSAYSANNVYKATVASWADSSGAGNTLTQATASKQPLLTWNALNSQRGVQFVSASAHELNSTLGLVATSTAASFIWGIARPDAWVSNARLWGCKGTNTFLAFMNGTTPKVSMFGTGAVPASGSAGFTIGSFKRLQELFTGSTSDYLTIGSVSTTGQNSGATGGVSSTFTLGVTASVFCDVTFTEAGVAQADPGSTALNSYASSEWGASILT